MKLIALVPVKNGEIFIRNWFHLNKDLVDGFVIFDDGSTDNTESLLNIIPNILEVVKSDKSDELFDDAYNRNMLLESAKKYNPDYIFWIDIDEVWKDLANIRDFLIKNNPIHLYLPLVHLYDDENQYVKSYPNSHLGVQWKCRIVKFSEYNDFQFPTQNKLHFSLSRDKQYVKFYPMFIRHHGHFTEEMRLSKFEFYLKNDMKKLQSYTHLISENHKFGLVSEIENEIKNLKYNWD
jgi:hypothetical protein